MVFTKKTDISRDKCPWFRLGKKRKQIILIYFGPLIFFSFVSFSDTNVLCMVFLLPLLIVLGKNQWLSIILWQQRREVSTDYCFVHWFLTVAFMECLVWVKAEARHVLSWMRAMSLLLKFLAALTPDLVILLACLGSSNLSWKLMQHLRSFPQALEASLYSLYSPWSRISMLHPQLWGHFTSC